jgi:probable HAF family extracellular repeat protein
MIQTKSFVCIAICLLGFEASAPANAQSYSAEVLRGLPGAVGEEAIALNNQGVVVGESVFNCGDDCGTLEATLWSHGRIQGLGGLPGWTSSDAYGINNLGQVVGDSTTNEGDRATEWSGGRIINLGRLPGMANSAARDINSFGQVVGVSTDITGATTEATEWSQGKIVDLGRLPGSAGSFAAAINDSGQVAGNNYINGSYEATEWSHGKIIDLGRLPGSTNSFAQAINNSGVIVGYSVFKGYDEATEWSDRKMIDLGRLPGTNDSAAFGINDFGDVVGSSAIFKGCCNSTFFATLWSDGAIINLDAAIVDPPHHSGGFPQAQGINDKGQIIVSLLTQQWLLTPLPVAPEPSTWAMMLLGFLGLGGLGLKGRRRAAGASMNESPLDLELPM